MRSRSIRFGHVLSLQLAKANAATLSKNKASAATLSQQEEPRCGALSLLQKDAALQGGIKQKPL